MKEEENYYKRIYSQGKKNENLHKNDIRKMDTNSESPKLKLEYYNSEDLIKDITEEEVWKIIKESLLNKSPGLDGYTME